ncbi:MAG: hypothetical protein E6G19_03735 [Actinobacteria bacterium]|nr:MAG: hypothetical protein E6G19_03735 [Actinomycetota bacterium]
MKVAPISAAASSSTKLTVRTLTDRGQQPLEIAQAIADWLGEARRSLELAQYDFHLAPDTAAVVAGGIREASARGVAVRIIYNVDHRNPIPVPPPPEPDVQLIQALGVPSKAVGGVPDLMHHKFVVRDRQAVWTGSLSRTSTNSGLRTSSRRPGWWLRSACTSTAYSSARGSRRGTARTCRHGSPARSRAPNSGCGSARP